jgi:hypothetical protein
VKFLPLTPFFYTANALKTKIRLWVLGAPFGKKDVLKQRKYRWNTGEKEGHKA